jgi:hypothetical protein
MRTWCLYLALAIAALAEGCGGKTCCVGPDDAVLRIALAMSGLDLDNDGALASVDQAPSVVVPREQAVSISLPPGHHTITLSGLAPNCTVAGGVSREVEVNAGEAREVTFEVTCIERDGVLRFITATSGSDLDPDGYYVTLRLPVPRRFHLAANDTVLVTDVPPGLYGLTLDGLASNCSFSAPPALVSVVARDTARVQVSAVCTAIPPTGMDITIATSGNDRDDAYRLVVCVPDYYYDCDPVWFDQPVPADTTIHLEVPAGYYETYLDDVARNCTVAYAGDGRVIAYQVTAVEITVTCRTVAEFEVTVTGSGSDVPDAVGLSIAYCCGMQVPVGTPFRVAVAEGSQDLTLVNLPQNCQTTSPNPVTVSLVPGVLTPVAFTLSCEAFPRVVVTVNSAGTNIPSFYGLWVDSYTNWNSIASNGALTLRVAPGAHHIWLDAVPSNCSVTTPNPIFVSGALGQVIDAAFTVVCQ